MLTRVELDYRIDQAAERNARLIVAFRRLATVHHETHDSAGMYLTCSHPDCRAAVEAMRNFGCQER